MIADRLGINMTGKELLDGFLASTEYQQAMNGLSVVFKACKYFNDGKINERQVEKTVKKYLRRTGQDAADSISELSEIFQSFTRSRLNRSRMFTASVAIVCGSCGVVRYTVANQRRRRLSGQCGRLGAYIAQWGRFVSPFFLRQMQALFQILVPKKHRTITGVIDSFLRIFYRNLATAEIGNR